MKREGEGKGISYEVPCGREGWFVDVVVMQETSVYILMKGNVRERENSGEMEDCDSFPKEYRQEWGSKFSRRV